MTKFLNKGQKEALGNLYYQVCNGGLDQYLFNGYSKEMPKVLEALDEAKLTLKGNALKDIKAILKMINNTTIYTYPNEERGEELELSYLTKDNDFYMVPIELGY